MYTNTYTYTYTYTYTHTYTYSNTYTYRYRYIRTSNIPSVKPNTSRQNVGSVVHMDAAHPNFDNLYFALTHVPAAMHPVVEVARFLLCQYHSLFYDARKLP